MQDDDEYDAMDPDIQSLAAQQRRSREAQVEIDIDDEEDLDFDETRENSGEHKASRHFGLMRTHKHQILA